MLDAVTRYIRRLGFPAAGGQSFTDDEIADAIAALFKQVVLADGVVRSEEIATAMRSLMSNYAHLDLGEGKPGITERFSEAKPETVYSIATVLNRSLSRDKRGELKMQLIAVAMADREFHLYEREYLDLVDKLIPG